MANQGTAGQFSLFIVIDGHGCKVVPPSQPAHRGDSVTFKAGGTAAKLWFPDSELFPQLGPSGRLDLAMDEERSLTVGLQAVIGKRYHYGAFCVDGGAFAIGHSDPEIIIFP